MKKNKINLYLCILVILLIFASPVWATECVVHVVKPGESLRNIAEEYTGSSDYSQLIARKNSAGKAVFLKNNYQLIPGERVYIVKAKIKNSSVNKSSIEKPVTKSSVLQKKGEGDKKKLKTKTTPLITQKKPEYSDDFRIKTDFKKGLKNGSGSIGYSLTKDWDGGSKDTKDRGGHSWQGSFNFFPWEINWKKRVIQVGPKVKYSQGASISNDSEYRWRRPEARVRIESEKENVTLGGEVGISKQTTERLGKGEEQKTWSSHWKADYKDDSRRSQDKKLLPKHSLSIDYRHPLNAKNSGGSKEYDEKTLKARVNFDIFDFYPKNQNLRITPDFNLLGGYVWGKKSIVVGGGPGISAGDKSGNFLEAKFYNPEIYLDNPSASRLRIFSLNFKPDNLKRTLKAGQIKKYAPDDEENENSIKEPFSPEEQEGGR